MYPFNVAAAGGGIRFEAGQSGTNIGYDKAVYGVLLSGDDARGFEFIQGSQQVGGTFILRLRDRGGVVSPPDTDATFKQVRVRGTFVAGPGTFTVLRSAMAYTPQSVGYAMWTVNPLSSSEWIVGNVYALSVE